MRLFNRLFCKHEWVKISFRDAFDEYSRYSMRTYECKKCGKQKEVDGRFDYINR